MGTALRPIGHEDRLSLVDHLDELRTRIIICACAFIVCFGVALWQDDRILNWLDRPLELSAVGDETTKDPLEQSALYDQNLKQLSLTLAVLSRQIVRDDEVDAETRAAAVAVQQAAQRAALSAPEARGRRPVTLGVGEPFTVTFRVAAYAALLLSMPILLYQAYAFILPAFSPRERQVALPLMTLVPFLFIAGVAFAYFIVLPRAIDFLQNFNDDSFDILIQARDYYRFSIVLMAVMGLMFQVPVGILALTRVGIVNVTQLRQFRRYAIVLIAVIAMLGPGVDPVTMLIMMVPLVILYEGSILLAALLDRRAARREAAEASAALEPVEDTESHR